MAKPGRKPAGDGESVSGYFRSVFEERPELLEAHSNDELFLRWLMDHPGEKEVPERVRQGLSNLKSVLRKRRKTRRKMRKEAEAAGAQAPGARHVSSASLMKLESQIDEALVMARHLDPEGLEDIVRLLHTARNRVIIRLGAP